jgi:DAACS family dicarboxylate/amino acid:cation (Na+ or H+) symporter
MKSGWPGLRPQILLLAGFVLGTGGGTLVEFFAPDSVVVQHVLYWLIRPVEQIFLTALFLLIAPLLFSAIVSGLSRMRDTPGIPGLLATTLAYMVSVSAAAALIGLAMANLFRPGDGIPSEIGQQLLSLHVVPSGDGVLGFVPGLRSINTLVMIMVVLSIAICGVLPLLSHRSRSRLRSACEKLFEQGMRVLGLVTRFAPIAVACFMFDLMVMFGWHLLFYLSAYIVVVIAALVFQVFVTFFALVWMRGDMSPGVFLHGVQEAAVIAFCTSSSNVTLPTALKVAETDLGLPARVVRPVLGIGTVANQSGTTIYIAVTVLFIGQFFGMDLSLDRQALVFAIAMLAGMGTVGVPAGALPAVATVLALTGLPPEGIGLVIGVDRLLDMFRTLVNVVGDLAIAVAIEKEPVVARSDADIAARELPR